MRFVKFIFAATLVSVTVFGVETMVSAQGTPGIHDQSATEEANIGASIMQSSTTETETEGRPTNCGPDSPPPCAGAPIGKPCGFNVWCVPYPGPANCQCAANQP